MRTSVKPLSDVEMKVEVEIPAEQVDREYGRQLAAIRKRARIKGFRPGKAPKEMVKRLYADTLSQETARELMLGTAGDALESVDRPLVGEPSFEPAPAKEGEPLTYAMRVQVKPEITLSNWKGIDVAVPPAEVDAEAVDHEIEQLREQHKERVPVEDRGADTGDLLVLDTVGRVDGEVDERLTIEGLEVKLGDRDLLPGLGDQLMGAKAGEERDVTVTFPEDFGAEDLQGKEAELHVEVKEHFLEELPELDDDFAQDVGHDDLEALRESIRERQQEQADAERDRELERKLVEVLLARHDFNAPPAMVQAQADGQARQLATMLMMQGMPRDQAIEILRGSNESIVQDAERAVKRHLALEALAEQEDIEIGDEAVQAAIDERVEQGGAQAAERYEEDEARAVVRLELQDRAALDLVKEHANITDAPPETEDEAAPDEASEAAGESDGEAESQQTEGTE
ncbi:MAG: trigger factor [Myxococcota bacterium]